MDFSWDDPAVAEQIPINQAIAEGLIAFIPDAWDSAEVRLGFSGAEGGVTLRVVNPDTGEGWTASHDLTMAAIGLDEHRRKYGLGWRSAVYGVRADESGEWQVTATFE
jgi:hypothetical protein